MRCRTSVGLRNILAGQDQHRIKGLPWLRMGQLTGLRMGDLTTGCACRVIPLDVRKVLFDFLQV